MLTRGCSCGETLGTRARLAGSANALRLLTAAVAGPGALLQAVSTRRPVRPLAEAGSYGG